MEVTTLLEKWRRGEAEAAAEIVQLVYGELHKIAAALMRREAREHTLQPTALVNELFLRLAGDKKKDWKDRTHFLAVAARAMRQVLVDHARRNLRAKRGGDRIQVELPDEVAAQTIALDEVLEWNELLEELERMDPRSARIVELRWFTGLEVKEIAEALGVSEKTVKRDWAVTRAWLKTRMKSRGTVHEPTAMGEAEGTVPPGAGGE